VEKGRCFKEGIVNYVTCDY